MDKSSREDSHPIDLTDIVQNRDETMEIRCPYIEHVYPGLKEVTKRKGRRLIKTHLPSHLLPVSALENGSKIIYIYRNPKDVIVSYYHFARMLTYANYKGTLDKFARSFMKDCAPYSPYFPHINGYLRLKSENPTQILVISYEDIKAG